MFSVVNQLASKIGVVSRGAREEAERQVLINDV